MYQRRGRHQHLLARERGGNGQKQFSKDSIMSSVHIVLSNKCEMEPVASDRGLLIAIPPDVWKLTDDR